MSDAFRVELFGGGGYVGQVFHSVSLPGVVVVRSGARENDKPLMGVSDLFVHLACPRNEPAVFDLNEARRLLYTGLERGHTVGKRVYISSMSVFDVPDNPYARFKREGEREAIRRGWSVVRLGTVLGLTPNWKYRKDLGLHRVAKAVAAGEDAWVNAEIRRCVLSTQSLLMRCTDLIGWARFGNLPMVEQWYDSCVHYHIITLASGHTVKPKLHLGGFSISSSYDTPLIVKPNHFLVCAFNELVDAIVSGKAEEI